MAVDWDREIKNTKKAEAAGYGAAAGGVGMAAGGARAVHRGTRQMQARVKGEHVDVLKPDRTRQFVADVKDKFHKKNNTPAIGGKPRHFKSTAAAPKTITRGGAVAGLGVGAVYGGLTGSTYAREKRDDAKKSKARLEARRSKVAKAMSEKKKRDLKTSAATGAIGGAGLAGMAAAGRGAAKKYTQDSVDRASGYTSRPTHWNGKKIPTVGRRHLYGTALAATGAGIGGIGVTDTYLKARRKNENVTKRKVTTQNEENRRLRRAKKFNVGTSTASGVLGIAALGALGARGLPKAAASAGKGVKTAQKISDHGTKATVPLSAASLGVGGVGSLNFARVQNQEANRIKVKKSKDGMNITEHQRRARDSRRTVNRGKNIAGAGGAVVGTAALLGSRVGADVGMQTLKAAKGMKMAGKALGSKNSTTRSMAPSIASGTVKDNPYGTAVLGGATAMGAGGATALGGRINEKRHDRAVANLRRKRSVAKSASVSSGYSGGMDFGLSNVRQGQNVVSKAYDPERSRQRRMDNASTALSAGAGALGLGAGMKASDAVTNFRQSRATESAARQGGSGSGRRAVAALNLHKKGLKATGKAGALGAGAAGSLMAAEQIQRYKKGRGASYNKRSF